MKVGDLIKPKHKEVFPLGPGLILTIEWNGYATVQFCHNQPTWRTIYMKNFEVISECR